MEEHGRSRLALRLEHQAPVHGLRLQPQLLEQCLLTLQPLGSLQLRLEVHLLAMACHLQATGFLPQAMALLLLALECQHHLMSDQLMGDLSHPLHLALLLILPLSVLLPLSLLQCQLLVGVMQLPLQAHLQLRW